MGQRIQKVQINNFKPIENFEAELNGQNVLLIADNDRGKSSFIQAIEFALGLTETQPPEPYRKGSDDLWISVTTDGEYTFTVKGKDGKKPKIEVKGPDGIPTTKKGVISQLVGAVEFDVWEFVQLSKTKSGRQKQIEIVKGLLPQETQDQLEKIKNKVNELYKEREEIGRDLKSEKGFLESSGLTDEDFENYQLFVDLDQLQNEYQQAVEHNNQLKADENKVETLKSETKALEGEIDEIDEQIRQLQEKKKRKQETISQQQNQKNQLEGVLKESEYKDLADINKRLKEAQEHNRKVDQVKNLNETKVRVEQKQEDYENLSQRIEDGRKEYQKQIRNSDLPIDGLLFDEEAGYIYYQGFPVDENQLSESTIMILGAKIKMAQSKNFSVLFMNGIQDLGQKKFNDLLSLCEQHGFQLIGEQVERGQDELKIEIVPHEKEK